MGMSFPVPRYTAVPQCSGSPEKSFLRGESSAAAGGSTGGAVIRGCDDAASFMTEKRTEGDGWKISSRQCGSDTGASGGSTAENTLSAGTEAAETDTAKQDSNQDQEQKEGRQNRRSRELREDQKDGTQKR